jgi:3-oxoacyl-[acyl-carrier protein] reductase
VRLGQHRKNDIMDQLIKDRVAILTGSGRGIGQAAAKLLAQEGAKVVICDLDSDPCLETVAAINSAGGSAIPCIGDLTARGFPEKIIGTCVGAFGPSIDIIVNNAGYGGAEFIHEASDTLWQTMLKINLSAPFEVIRAASPYMRARAKAEISEGKRPKCRKIVNISSVAATDGLVASTAYSSAKAGLLGLTKSLAKEYGPYNICVNAIALGLIDTRLSGPREKGREAKIGNIMLGFPENVREKIIRLTPLGRIGTVEEAAGVILFLASPFSDYITGQIIKVSGGF